MRMGGQRHVPAALPLGKIRYPLYRRLDGPQGRSGRGGGGGWSTPRPGRFTHGKDHVPVQS